MSRETLLSVAQISRAIDAPESTVHYWKHRFAQHLPSRGRGRQMRFTAEAVDIFTLIRDMMRAGNPADTIAAELAERFPLTPETRPSAVPQAAAPAATEALQAMGQEMGLEIAKALTQGILSATGQGAGIDQQAVQDGIDQATAGLVQRIQGLEQDNHGLREKIEVMEAELVRLRKDRREMERYLLDKIDKMHS